MDRHAGLDILDKHGWDGDRELDDLLVRHSRVKRLLDKGFLTFGERGLL